MNGEEERKMCRCCKKNKTIRSFEFNKWINDRKGGYLDTCFSCMDIENAVFCKLMGIRQ